LVVEVDMSSPEATASFQYLIQNEGYYRDGQTLKDHISEETYTELLSYLAKMRVPTTLVEKQKPGIVVLTLAALQAELTGLDPSMGIDLYFLNNAKKHMKIVSLETAEQQIRIFLDIKDADLLLRDSFYSLEMLENEMGILVNAWKLGDEKVIHRLLFDDVLKENSALAVLYESLYFQRNVTMTNSIKQFLAKKGQYFVVVGAGHLIGDKGIVRLLQDAGFRITRQ
ncbi:MAG: TraB/GumN family protein, partial [Gammaproteobacteria bacterium]|nr:TraB/GumN family protein [Gammaproteobacteria bacterium]